MNSAAFAILGVAAGKNFANILGASVASFFAPDFKNAEVPPLARPSVTA